MAIREIPAIPFVESLKKTLVENYCNFNGRARRSEFWYFALFGCILGVVLSILMSILGDILGSVVSLVVSLAVFLPQLGVHVRRLHDINKSGWWLLINFVPLLGSIILIVWACKDSDPLTNQYGASPKYVDVD